MTSTAHEKAPALVLRLLFGGALLLLALFVLLADMRELILFVPDDASYYLKIAQNVCNGNGFSFDGLHATNGFQPMWQYVTVALLWLLHTSPETTVRVLLLFQLLVLGGSGILLYRVLSKYLSSKALLIGTVCFLAFVLPQATNGMETALLVFMLALLLVFSEKYRPFTQYAPKTEVMLGLLLGLTLLTRLDFVFLCVPVYLLCLYQSCINRSFRKDVMRVLAITVGIAIFLLPYVVYNYVSFGHVVPISGHLKFPFPQVSLAGKMRDLLAHRESYFAVLPPIYLLWFFGNRKRPQLPFLFPFLAVMAAGLCLLFLCHLLFMQWMYFSWYFVPYSLFFCLAASAWVNLYLVPLRSRLLPWAYGLFVLGVLTYRVQNYLNYSRQQNNWSLYTYDAAQWVKTHTAPQDILAMKDAGHFGFFSERRVINLDGLVNTFEFQQTLHQKQLRQYLTQNRVRYLAQHSIWNHEEITDGNYETYPFALPSRMYGSSSDSILLRKENEVYRSAPYEEGGWRVVFVVWEIGKP